MSERPLSKCAQANEFDKLDKVVVTSETKLFHHRAIAIVAKSPEQRSMCDGARTCSVPIAIGKRGPSRGSSQLMRTLNKLRRLGKIYFIYKITRT